MQLLPTLSIYVIHRERPLFSFIMTTTPHPQLVISNENVDPLLKSSLPSVRKIRVGIHVCFP